MYTPTGQTTLDVDTILGIPRPTKKPSSLLKPRQPPPPRYINKERALAIAKKFKIKQIGKVTVRAGSNNALDDPPSVNLESDKVLTRRILLDREKGLETAMNTKDSAVGKCILGRNDYETRRLGVAFDKLAEDSEKKSYQLLKRKSLFVHQRGLTLTQGGIVFDPTAATNNQRGLSDTQTPTDAAKPLPAIQTSQLGDGVSGEGTSRPKRDKSPSYMRPLSCDRTRSINSQVAEVERFLATPTMMRYVKGSPGEDSTTIALKSVSEANSLDIDDYGAPSKRIFQTETRRKSELPEIPESVPSEGSDCDDVFGAKVSKTHFKNAENFPITNALSRSRSVDQGGSTVKVRGKRRHSTAYSGLRRTSHTQTVHKPSKPDDEKKEQSQAAAAERVSTPTSNSRRRSHRKSSTFSTTNSQFKHKKKHRKTRVSFSQREPPEPSKDPRFTELTSFLVPDSAKAFDLYRAMGRLSVLERLEQSGARSSGLRAQMGKVGHVRKSENLKAFDALF